MPKRSLLALTLALVVATAAYLLPSGRPEATGPQPAVHVGSYVWTRDEGTFGGFSGLDLEPDGLGFVAITDRGFLYRGRLRRDASGKVTGVETDGPRAIAGPGGRPLRRGETDSEGVALAPDGTLYISFEGLDRIAALPDPDGPLIEIPRADPFRRLPQNSGLEALAIDPEGRPVTLPEESGAAERPFPVWRWTGTGWEQPYALPRDGDFVPTGADFGPDGALYLLERQFRYLMGFRSRVSRFEIGPDGPGPREILLETHGPVHDNLEGLAVWRDADGAIRLTMISDDNFSAFQRTEIVDYRLPAETGTKP